jgi:hypothetical protein
MVRFTLLTAALLLLLTGGLTAQSLDAEVQVDPNAGTCTYDFHFSGPPGGLAMIWLGPYSLIPPFQGPLGNLWIDPLFLIKGTSFLPLDPFGQLQLSATIPANLAQGLPLVFQSLNLDVGNILQFSQNSVALSYNLYTSPCLMDYSLSYRTVTDQYQLAGSAPSLSVIEFQVVDGGGVRHAQNTSAALDGQYSLNGNIPGGLQHGELLRIRCDGQLMEQIDMFRP